MSTATITRPVQPPSTPPLIKVMMTPEVRKRTDGQKSGQYSFTWSTPLPDRDNDVILPEAWDWTDYTKNPVVLFCHDYQKMPVGRATRLYANADHTMGADIDLLPPGISPEADQLRGMLDAGFPIAISPGFKPKGGGHRNIHGGRTFEVDSCQLMELSLVPVPANPGAVRAMKAAQDALRAKGPRTNDGEDPTRDPAALARCPNAQRGCPKRTGQPCAMAESCPLGLGSGAKHGGSVFTKARIDATEHPGHTGVSERERRNWAWGHGTLAVQARQRDEEQRARWDQLKHQVLAADPKDRPVLKVGIDVARKDWDALPRDVQAVVGGHSAPDARLEGLG